MKILLCDIGHKFAINKTEHVSSKKKHFSIFIEILKKKFVFWLTYANEVTKNCHGKSKDHHESEQFFLSQYSFKSSGFSYNEFKIFVKNKRSDKHLSTKELF